jgi:U32 family peptidase
VRFNTFVSSKADLQRCVQAPQLQEVLIESTLLARQGRLSAIATRDLARAAQELGLRSVLVWDALMPEQTLQSVVAALQDWDLSIFSAIRVSDLGAARWVVQQLPQMPLQLVVEAGNHNLEALLGWCEYFAPSLERLVLSIELPEAKLAEYCQTLPVLCEVLGAGPILLFYSPRSLLASQVGIGDQENDSYLQTHITYEDAPNRLFPTLETEHGTFMFLDKDQFILDRLAKLDAAGCHTVRIDVRHLSKAGEAANRVDQICQQALSDPVGLRAQWPKETRAPFFNANRTTHVFPRLRSKLTGQRQETCLAESIAGEGKHYVVFQSLRSFTAADIDCIQLPTGETLPMPENWSMRDLEGNVVDVLEGQQLFMTDWVKKVVAGSLLMGR